MATKLSKYFTLEELTTTSHRGIDNTPSEAIKQSLIQLAKKLLDPVRDLLDCPIHVNSGYRSIKLNETIGGSKTSQHCKGEAADIVPLNKIALKKSFEKIMNSDLPYDQIIYEKPKGSNGWIHVSFKAVEPRKQALMFTAETKGKYLPYDGSKII